MSGRRKGRNRGGGGRDERKEEQIEEEGGVPLTHLLTQLCHWVSCSLLSTRYTCLAVGSTTARLSTEWGKEGWWWEETEEEGRVERNDVGGRGGVNVRESVIHIQLPCKPSTTHAARHSTAAQHTHTHTHTVRYSRSDTAGLGQLDAQRGLPSPQRRGGEGQKSIGDCRAACVGDTAHNDVMAG